MNLLGLANNIPDFRLNRQELHPSENIIFITMAAVICGASDWDEIEDFGKCKIDFFSRYLDLNNGIPSHDTFNRFFSLIKPDILEEKFREWVLTICEKDSNVVAIDGKTIRGAKENGKKSVFHMVSAFCCANGLSLGQIRTEEKSNEITAIPKLISALNLEKCIVTIDAMGCQTNIAKAIIDAKADYILAVKDNQKELRTGINDSFLYSSIMNQSIVEEVCGHGRMERRMCTINTDLSHINKLSVWKDLKTLVKIESTRFHKSTGKEEETQIRYYISSAENDAKFFNTSIRSHWHIENKLHWVLDVDFKEDFSRKRSKDSAINFSLIAKIALSKLKSHTLKKSIKRKIKSAGWDDQLLYELLAQ